MNTMQIDEIVEGVNMAKKGKSPKQVEAPKQLSILERKDALLRSKLPPDIQAEIEMRPKLANLSDRIHNLMAQILASGEHDGKTVQRVFKVSYQTVVNVRNSPEFKTIAKELFVRINNQIVSNVKHDGHTFEVPPLKEDPKILHMGRRGGVVPAHRPSLQSTRRPLEKYISSTDQELLLRLLDEGFIFCITKDRDRFLAKLTRADTGEVLAQNEAFATTIVDVMGKLERLRSGN